MISVEQLRKRVELSKCGRFVIHKNRDDARPGWNTRYAGKRAFTAKNSNGYYHSTVDGVSLTLHKVIWALNNGRWPEGHIDHINCDRTDNHISNLRIVTTSQNGMNRGPQKNNRSSGVKGVTWDKNRSLWKSTISIMGKTINIGRFTCLGVAISERRKYSKHLHGEFGRG